MNRINSILFLILILFNNTLLKVESNYTLDFDSKNWSYDSTNKVYYQIGVVYCTSPVDTNYQSLGIYVPEEYLVCSNVNEKYDCKINSSGKKGLYSATNAPVVFPVETPGYAPMKAPTAYNYKTVSNFVSQGIVYIYAGCRGKYAGGEEYTAGAPWGVTDLKSAIRFLRYNSKLLPGDLNRMYSFGMSGGGAQSCLMGVTGNSEFFTKYLEDNGAALKDADGNEIKDNIKGSQCWCPITNLDTADAAYEWNMGQYYSTNTRAEGTFTRQLSSDLANKYFEYVNELKLKDPSGNELTLTELNKGTYYDYLLKIIEESLNNFLSDTKFPYDPSQKGDDDFPPGPPHERRLSTIYNTPQEYIDHLNEDFSWVTYDSSTNKAKITSVGDFAKKCKSPTKSVGAFDSFNKTQAENYVFGVDGANYAKHFSQIISDLLNKNKDAYSKLGGWDASYPDEYTKDLAKTDSIGKTIKERVSIYNPMFYLSEHYEGYQRSDVADYFRINSGIFQSDTGNVVEMNLYLALLNYGKNAEFTTVWEKQHVKAERTGSAEDNFIAWVNKIESPRSDDSAKSIKFNCLLIGLLLLLL